jgi:hypothetical protein
MLKRKRQPTLVMEFTDHLKAKREERERLEDRKRLGIDVTSWRHEQRPPHIYIQVNEKLVRYTLRSLEVYVPEDQKL